MLVKDVREFRSMPVRGLDNQVVWKFNQMKPGVLVSIADLDIAKGDGLMPYLQKSAKNALQRYIEKYKQRLTINNAYRSIIVQTLFWNNRNLAGGLVAYPGKSDHGNGAAIDINEWESQKTNLINAGWHWSYGRRDAMHFDWVDGIEFIKDDTVKAFQALWNEANPKSAIAVDGLCGSTTIKCIEDSPAEGFPDLACGRVLRLTAPMQTGNDVSRLQKALISTGINFNSDGIFGLETDKAVKQFQSANNLFVDGIISVGGETATKLKLTPGSLIS